MSSVDHLEVAEIGQVFEQVKGVVEGEKVGGDEVVRGFLNQQSRH